MAQPAFSMNRDALKTAIKEKAADLGFNCCGVARAQPVKAAPKLRAWLEAGYHAEMGYLSRRTTVRSDPGLLLAGARSIWVVAMNYYQPVTGQVSGLISRYAWGEDYHRVLGRKLEQLVCFIQALHPKAISRYYVDSGAIMEKYWAVQAGIGWQGKHTLIISPPFGSWIFLGVIITTLECEPDSPIENRCGSCRRCLDACPTGAIVRPYVLDARRCIAYYTIEWKADRDIPPNIRAAMKGQLFGCDICQQVCPFNENAIISAEPAFAPRQQLIQMTLTDFESLNETTFAQLFKDSPLQRIKWAGLRRNLQSIKTSK